MKGYVFTNTYIDGGQGMEKLSNPQVTIQTIKKYEFAFQKKFGQN